MKKIQYIVSRLILLATFLFGASTLGFLGIMYFVQAAGPVITGACSTIPTTTLKKGSVGVAVQDLQKLLNLSPVTQIASTGPGSPGDETTTFGALTQAAVIRFQQEYAAEILTPLGLIRGTGFVGAATLDEFKAMCGGASASAPSVSLAPSSASLVTPSPSVSVATPTVSPSTSSTTTVAASTGSSNGNSSGRHHNQTSSDNSSGSQTSSSNSSTPALVTINPSSASSSGLQWGAYVGDGSSNLSAFESLVGNKPNLYATFEGWDTGFPTDLASTVGEQGMTLVVFWEPDFGYSQITNGSEDSYIQQFAAGAKSYGYPVILVPFDEMNLNEQAWGYGINGNTAQNFIAAWQHIHNLFASAGASNVKFAIDYNNVSEPNVSGNQFTDYYPGSSYVDYVGIDGFNFGNPWQTFDQVFDSAVSQAQSFGKPIYLLSVGSTEGSQKAEWITEGLGQHIETYADVAGWIWFNQNDADVPSSGDTADWTINSDPAALAAFQAVIP